MTKKELIQMLNYIGKLGRRFPATPAEVELHKKFFPAEEVEIPEHLKEWMRNWKGPR